MSTGYKPQHYKYRLYIKAAKQMAPDALRQLLTDRVCAVDSTYFRRYDIGQQDIVEVIVGIRGMRKIYEWFNDANAAPFPDGTLLYFMELEIKHADR